MQRSYNVRNYGGTARLRVVDRLGQDKLSLVSVQFVPAVLNWGSAAANTNEQHVLTITISNTFDSPVNVNNTGNYVWALRAGGSFLGWPIPQIAGAACAGLTTTGYCDVREDSVTYVGKGTFSPTLINVDILSPAGSPANTQPLSVTVGAALPYWSFDGLTNTSLGQVAPYPTFICDDNGGTAGGACKPTITQTMTVTLKGPDPFRLVNGQDAFGANCAVELSDQQEKQINFLKKQVKFLSWLERQRPNPRRSTFINKIETFLATINSPADDSPNCSGGVKLVNLDIAVAAAADQIAFAEDGEVQEAEPAPR